MGLLKRVLVVFALSVAFCLPAMFAVFATPRTSFAQTYSPDDNTTLKQIIIFGRHSIRSTVTSQAELNGLSGQPYPSGIITTPPGLLTQNGKTAEGLLGAYFQQYLIQEGLLTGNPTVDAAQCYFRSNSIERSYETALAFQNALIPNTAPAVRSYPFSATSSQPDPVFDPILAGVAQVDPSIAVSQAQALYNTFGADGPLPGAYSAEYALIHNVLSANGASPPKVDPTTLPIVFSPGPTPYMTSEVINPGGLALVEDAVDPFVMEYADGLPLGEVAWGLMSEDQISQQTRAGELLMNIEMRLPYLDQVQSSNVGAHILRTLALGASFAGPRYPRLPALRSFGAFGNERFPVVVVISSDTFVSGLAGLLNLHWQLPTYQPDFCAPGGALVFELRQNNSNRAYIVRVYYTAQSLDQLRNLTRLSLSVPPETVQLLIPFGSGYTDISYNYFSSLLTNAIDWNCVEDRNKEQPPGVFDYTGPQ